MKAYVQLLGPFIGSKDDKVKPYVDRTLVQINKLNSTDCGSAGQLTHRKRQAEIQ